MFGRQKQQQKQRNANKTKTPRKGKRVVDGKTPGKKLRKITSKLD